MSGAAGCAQNVDHWLDPGIAGAIAILDQVCVVHLDYLPTHRAQHGQKAKIRRQLDLHTLCDTLARHTIAHYCIEQVGPMPKQGLASTFRLAESYGQVRNAARSSSRWRLIDMSAFDDANYPEAIPL